jgi:hypothetical protein
MNKTSFLLPAIVNNQDAGRIKELRLYVKNGPGDWVLKTTTPPSQPSFQCTVAQDGEYWFDIIAVDLNGNPAVPDFSQTASMLVVFVDTQRPEVEVKALPSPGNEQLVQCTIRDANPDPAATKVEYQVPGQNWQALEPVADQSGVYKVPGGHGTSVMVRATATDQAGNSATHTIRLNGTNPAAAMVPLENQSEKLTMLPPPEPTPLAKMPPAPTGAAQRPLQLPTETAVTPLAYKSAEPTPMPVRPASAGQRRQLVNRNHIALKYQIEQLGPSGLGTLEVWMTRDQGQTWQHLCDDPDRQNRVEVDLPKEDGVYGLSLVARNGMGFGGKPPVHGEAPDLLVEVDTTKPVAELRDIQPVTGSEAPTLLIVWNASDKNLAEEPIQLLYAPGPDGPWQSAAARMKNTGSYRWSVPPGVGPQIFVRLAVSDEAGNVAQCDAPPVKLDLTQPKVHVLGVETVGH